MSKDLGPSFGGSVEGAPPGLANLRSQRRLARDAAGYREEEEKLLGPAAFGAQGGGIFLLSAVGALVVTVVTPLVAGGRMGAAGDVVWGAGLALTFLLLLLAVPFTHGCAVVLTDRRLMVFRTGKFRPRVKKMLLAVPRSEVSTACWPRWGVGVLSLEFAPAAGRAPMKPYFLRLNILAAGSIHDALMTPAGGADASLQPGKAA